MLQNLKYECGNSFELEVSVNSSFVYMLSGFKIIPPEFGSGWFDANYSVRTYSRLSPSTRIIWQVLSIASVLEVAIGSDGFKIVPPEFVISSEVDE